MSGILKFISDSGGAGYTICFFGVIAIGFMIERGKALFFDYNIKSESFMKQLNSLLLADQIEEAVTFCDANKKKPMVHIIKAVLERADRDEESMKKAFEIAFTEVMPNVTKRIGYLALLSNVATLLGLLGTIQGIILAFDAVAFADPSQKQTLLASGISVAMYTTAMGLTAAIPIMVSFSILNAKKDKILTDCAENGSKVLDLLTSRIYRDSDSEANKKAA
jgi:biopolymer transport protein ExbB